MNQSNTPPRTFYGIDTDTYDIRCVSIYSDGSLSMATKSNPIGISKNISGKDPISEIAIVCGLTEIVEIPFALKDSDFEKQQLAELEEITKNLKAKKQGPTIS